MPEEYFESSHFKLPALNGSSPGHSIGTGFKKLAEKVDEVLWGRTVIVESGANAPNVLSWGYVNEAGTVEAGSGDYTVSKVTTGEYEVKWTKAKTASPYAVALTVQSSSGSAKLGGNPGTGNFYVQTYSTGGSAANEAFAFIVVAGS